MTTPLRWAAGALLALAMVAAGCSDDGGDEGDADGGPSAFAATFSEACTELDRAVEALPEPVGLDSLAAIAGQAAEATREGVEELRSIEVPAGSRAGVERLVAGLEAQADQFDDLAAAAAEGDAARVAALDEEGTEARERLGALADELGVDCGLPGEEGVGSGDDGDAGDEPSFGPPPSLDPASAESPTVIPEYGDEPSLDALARACAGGDVESCDLLALGGPPGSGYEEYGGTCGGRNESLLDDPGTFCVDRY